MFPVIFGFSLLGSFLGTYLSEPTDIKVLKSFYYNVRPWGWWNPVYETLKKEDNSLQKNTDFWLDMMNSLIGIIWQSSMILMPIFLIVRDYPKTISTTVVFIITSLILKFTWLDRVKNISN